MNVMLSDEIQLLKKSPEIMYCNTSSKDMQLLFSYLPSGGM